MEQLQLPLSPFTLYINSPYSLLRAIRTKITIRGITRTHNNPIVHFASDANLLNFDELQPRLGIIRANCKARFIANPKGPISRRNWRSAPYYTTREHVYKCNRSASLSSGLACRAIIFQAWLSFCRCAVAQGAATHATRAPVGASVLFSLDVITCWFS